MSATVATFTRRVETVDPNMDLAVPFCLVSNKLIEHTERGVTDRFGELVVTYHPTNVKVFGDDHIEAPNNVRSDFVDVVFATVGNLLLNLGNLDSLAVSAVTAFTAPRQHSLGLGKLGLVLADVLGVSNSLTATQGSQSRNAKINANALASLGQRLNLFVKAERHEVVTDRRLGYRHGGRAALELSAPANIQPTDLGDGQAFCSSIPLKCGSGVLGRLTAFLFLEAWVLTALIKEVVKCGLQMPQSLLCWHARNLIQPSAFWRLLERGQHGGRSVIVDLFAAVKGVGALAQCPVVDKAASAKRSCQMRLLIGRRIETESITRFHKGIVHLVSAFVKNNLAKAIFPPKPEGLGFHP